MNIYYNLTRQCRVDEDNCRLTGRPMLYFGEKPEWRLHLFTGELGEPGTAAGLDGIVSFRAAIDADWTGTTVPMCRTNSGITAADGVLTIPLDANTVRFAAVLDGKAARECQFELRGLDTDGNTALIVQFPVTCHNVIDPEGGEEPEETPSGYATCAYVDAVVSRRIFVQFSSDGTDWHDTLVSGDLYERIRHGSTGEWSSAFGIPWGPQGSGIPDAPDDGKLYARRSGAWVEVTVAAVPQDPDGPSEPDEPSSDPFDNIVDPGDYSEELLIV